MFQDVVLAATGDTTFPVTVSNGTDAPVRLGVGTLDFGSLDTAGGVAFRGLDKNFDDRYGLARWMSVDRTSLEVASGSTETVTVTVENSETLAPGGHYGAVIFRMTATGSNIEAPRVAVNQLFAALVFAKKVGGERMALTLTESMHDGNWHRLPEKVRLRFRNVGNVHLVPRGIVSLTDLLGREVRRGVINEESGIVLPETERLYLVALKPLARAFMPGWYELTLKTRFDGQDEFTVSTSNVFVFPPRILICVFAVVILVLWWFRQRRQHNASRPK